MTVPSASQSRVRVVCATRHTTAEFWAHTLLGQSLIRMPENLRPELALKFENVGKHCEGLPRLYNRAIDETPDDRILLFAHDDVFVHDVFLQQRLNDALLNADLVGLAGSRSAEPDQPSWGLAFDSNLEPTGWQAKAELHGVVSHTLQANILEHGSTPFPMLSCYGPTPGRCDLMDGLFLAARAETLKVTGLRFDERFNFHLYDIDFCRQARKLHLDLTTWPILVTHASGGNFCTPDWKAAARKYLEKWQSETPPPAKVSLPPMLEAS